LEATTNLPEPHEFKAKVVITHGRHARTYETQFAEWHHHHHSADEASPEYQDTHERAHAQDLQVRFAGRSVTTGQVVPFGLTGGLMPCPTAFSILLVCLQIKQFSLGFAIVLAFSQSWIGQVKKIGRRGTQIRFRAQASVFLPLLFHLETNHAGRSSLNLGRAVCPHCQI
jgi:High-affinity nickel-transport protein